jgi:8-oxo-dGTP pyrophosphatase MutT (NUDIX family)
VPERRKSLAEMGGSWQHGAVLSGLLNRYHPTGPTETTDVARMARLAATSADPWSRVEPLHFTASALVVHPPTARVLLRWHVRLQRWLQVGGHGDPGESDPMDIALREAVEETGLRDLAPWPDESLWHAVICDVPATAAEPAHEHADLRFVFATATPEAIAPENAQSPLRWLTLDEARELSADGSLRDTLERVARAGGRT